MAGAKSPLAAAIENCPPSLDCFSASMPAPLSTAIISFAWRSDRFEYSSCLAQPARSRISAAQPPRPRRRRSVFGFIESPWFSGLLTEELRQAVRRLVGDARHQLAVEHELLAACGEHHHVAGRQ